MEIVAKIILLVMVAIVWIYLGWRERLLTDKYKAEKEFYELAVEDLQRYRDEEE